MKKTTIKKNKGKPQRSQRNGKKPAKIFFQDVDLFGQPITDAYFEPRYSPDAPAGWGRYSRYGDLL